MTIRDEDRAEVGRLYGEVLGVHIALLRELVELVQDLNEKVDAMSVSQSSFDSDLTALVNAIQTLISAYNAVVAKVPATADLSAEDAQVKTALASIETLLNPPAAPATGA